MLIRLDVMSGVPIYEQIKRGLSRLVLLGVLRDHEQHPSVRALAKEMSVNPNTVQKAYSELEKEGIIYSVSGKGNFIAPGGKENGPLRRRQLEAVTRSIEEARSTGLPLEEVLRVVRFVYQEGVPDD